ncbi:MAG: AI-2E family transporter [Candidatus Obscuribacterales bacterium]
MKDHLDLKLIQRQLTVALLALALLYILFLIGGYFADILRILGISVLVSYLFINAVDFLQKYLRNRAVCVIIVYASIVIITVLAAFLVVPQLVLQLTQMVETTFNKLPEFIQWVVTQLGPLEEKLRERHIDVKAIDIFTNIANSIPKPDPGILLSRVSDVAMSTATWVMYGISISVVTFYFLMDGYRIKEGIIRLFPERMRGDLNQIAMEMDRTLQAFFKGQIVLAALMGLVMGAIYLCLGVEYALVLSVFLAAWEILPVIGPPIGFAPALLAVAIGGMHAPGNNLAHMIIITVIFLVIQQIKDNVVGPKYMGNVIGVHPILIFVAIMVGARVDGMLGIIFSLPAACCINVLVNHLTNQQQPERVLDDTVVMTVPASPPTSCDVSIATPGSTPLEVDVENISVTPDPNPAG